MGEAANGDRRIADAASEVIAEIRKAKTEAKRSLRAEVAQLVVHDTADRLRALAACIDDVAAAGRVSAHQLTESETASIVVELAQEDPS